MMADYDPSLMVNGRELRRRSGNGCGWIPPSCRPEYGQGQPSRQDWEAIWFMEHYDLDPERGWPFCRDSFPWATKARPVLRALALRMSQGPQSVPGPRFTVHGPGDAIPFTHPITGEGHTLHVVEYEPQEMDPSRFQDEGEWEYPTHYTVMSYVVEPELPGNALTVRDCGEGDHPRTRQFNPGGPTAANSIGIIIGGADGPTAIILTNGKTGHPRAVCSALRFEPPKQIEWRMVFSQKTAEDIAVELPLPQN